MEQNVITDPPTTPHALSEMAAAAVILLGGVGLIGWVFDMAALKSVVPQLSSMKANTALALMSLGVSLWLQCRPSPSTHRLVARFLAAFAGVVGLLTLAEYLSGLTLGIDQIVFQDTAAIDQPNPGRMAGGTAVNLVLLGTALLVLDRGKNVHPAEVLSLVAGFISLLALAGYLFGVQTFSRIGFYSSMALHTALAFLLLAFGIFAARPDRGVMAIVTGTTAGGLMARRLLPAAFLVPFLFAWLILQGRYATSYSLEFGLVLYTLVNVAVFCALILWNARLLQRQDAERALAEAALRRSEAKYHDLYEYAPDMYVSVNAATAIVNECNATLAAATGYSKEEIVGRPVFDLYDPETLEEGKRAFHDFLTTGVVQGAELRLKHRDGHPIEVQLNVSAIRDDQGRIVASRSVWRDITERKRAEERFHQAVEGSPNAILLVNQEGRIVLMNRATETLFGYAREDLLGQPIEILLPQRVRDRHLGFRRDFLRAPSVRPMGAGRDLYARRKDGTEVPVEIGLAPIQATDGLQVLATVTDISARKQAEDALVQAQKMEAVGQLTGGIAHDFNNLLTVISGNLQMLEERVPEDAFVRQRIAAALQGATRGAELVRSLLAFARRQVLQPQRVDLNRLLAGMMPLLYRTLGETIEISAMEGGSDLWPTFVDPAQVETALLNLVLNARDAMPRGGKLTLETGNVRLDEAYAAREVEVSPGDYTMIAVSDTGIGMSEEIKHHAFEPFYTTKEAGKGSGLGLAMVYGFAKQSGGHVKIYSEPSQGTTVKCTCRERATGRRSKDPPSARTQEAANGFWWSRTMRRCAPSPSRF